MKPYIVGAYKQFITKQGSTHTNFKVVNTVLEEVSKPADKVLNQVLISVFRPFPGKPGITAVSKLQS